jgi:hypothetical protein
MKPMRPSGVPFSKMNCFAFEYSASEMSLFHDELFLLAVVNDTTESAKSRLLSVCAIFSIVLLLLKFLYDVHGAEKSAVQARLVWMLSAAGDRCQQQVTDVSSR